MIKRSLLAVMLMSSLCFVSTVSAQLIEEEPTFADNTGALSTSDNQADIISEGGSVDIAGAKEGEITIVRNDAGVVVYSGLNKVESIPTGSDGWVGSIAFESGAIDFQPAGRPHLNCPAQAAANWYGPCKLVEQETE